MASPVDHWTISADGTPIAFDTCGDGATALVFVHGWCCNRSFWDAQIEAVGQEFTVVRVDLAGHGDSGGGRTVWTMSAFGEDVAAVVRQLRLKRAILVGHSMGGSVIVEAGRRLTDSVAGLVGIDTWHDVLNDRDPAEIAELLATAQTDYVWAMRGNVLGMFLPESDSAVVERVMAVMSGVPQEVSLGTLAEYLAHTSELRKGFEKLRVPRTAINSTR